MQVAININQSLEHNAADYYEKAKKLKKKITGIKETIKRFEREYEKESARIEKERKKPAKKRQRRWYEKYRWFISSDGFLVVGGRDANTNEEVVKRHMMSSDMVLHTEMPGSPFMIIQSEGKAIPERTIKEAAQMCAVYSKGWKKGYLPSVFSIKPEQVTKEAKSGEYLGKGAFMIYGKKKFMDVDKLEVFIGCLPDGTIMAGPEEAIKKQTDRYVKVVVGDTKVSDLAKRLRKIIGGTVDELVKVLPGNGRAVT